MLVRFELFAVDNIRWFNPLITNSLPTTYAILRLERITLQ